MATQQDAGRRADDREVNRDIEPPRDANLDPVTKAPGAHPIGVGVGAAAAGTAGAVIGSVIPGAGTLLGGAIGAVLGAIGGGLAGKGIAEVIDPTAEEAYWRSELSNRPYYDRNFSYEDDYAPAYGFGYATRAAQSDRKFDESEDELRSTWEKARGKSRLNWEQAKGPVSDAWSRYDKLTDEDVVED